MLMPKVVQGYKELAKRKIIHSAYSVFYKKGYHASTMDDIALELGVSKGSLYSYFKSKEEILQCTVNQTIKDTFNRAFEDDNSLEPLEDLYNHLIKFDKTLHLNFEITALSSHDKQIQRIARDEYKKKLDIMTDFLRKLQNKGEIRDDIESATMARILIAIYSDVAEQLILGFNKMDIHENWKDSLAAVLDKNIHDDQKTLNKYFADV